MASKTRFQVELEFVQCLSNPEYLTFLAQSGYLEEPDFINYISYLQYWKKPEYLRYIRYPQCLYFLELLQNTGLRAKLKEQYYTSQVVTEQQKLHWLYNDRNRSQDNT